MNLLKYLICISNSLTLFTNYGFLADDVHTVYVETDDNQRVILCHLSKASKIFQCRLDHVFHRGTDLKFVTSASANIHMTGNLISKFFLRIISNNILL